MNNLLIAEIRHSICNVGGHLENLAQGRHLQVTVSVVLVVRPEWQRSNNSIFENLNISPMFPQILFQVAILHQLHENKDRLGLADHPNQFDHMLRADMLRVKTDSKTFLVYLTCSPSWQKPRGGTQSAVSSRPARSLS